MFTPKIVYVPPCESTDPAQTVEANVMIGRFPQLFEQDKADGFYNRVHLVLQRYARSELR
jgi:hypothetical protein